MKDEAERLSSGWARRRGSRLPFHATPLALQALCAAVLLPLPSRLASQTAHIADNSFLIEEAYNQEAGVVQHINTFSRVDGGGIWDYSLTQEWPFRGMRHQLSYTVPVLHADGFGTGLGDVLLNYRYQLVGDGEAPLHVAPRLSAVLPTGSEDAGRGSGSVGLQGNLPVSYVLSDALATHYNAGFTLEGESGNVEAQVGASAIWRVRHSVNLMVETVWNTAEDRTVLLNPGVRWAFDFDSGLQIVPGIAYTLALGPGSDAVFLYLSLEHPFRR